MLDNIMRRILPDKESMLEVDRVDYYSRIYKDRVRVVDQNWIDRQLPALEGAFEYQNRFAKFEVPWAMNSYSPDKTINSKITFVLWKMNSGCECLRQCGYCFNKHSDDCTTCPLHQAANIQLADIEAGKDNPTGKTKTEKDIIAKLNGQLIIENKRGRIQVLFSESDENKIPVECISRKITDTKIIYKEN